MNNIAKIIKALMEIHNLTQVDFAVKSDVPLPTVRKYLRSEFNPTEKNVEKIEKNFKVHLFLLLNIDLDNLDELEDTEMSYEEVCNDYSADSEDIEISKNTVYLINVLKKNISKAKKIIEPLNKNILLSDFKTSDKILIDLLEYLKIEIKINENRTVLIKKDNRVYDLDFILLKAVLSSLKKDVSGNFIKYLDLLDKYALTEEEEKQMYEDSNSE